MVLHELKVCLRKCQDLHDYVCQWDQHIRAVYWYDHYRTLEVEDMGTPRPVSDRPDQTQ